MWRKPDIVRCSHNLYTATTLNPPDGFNVVVYMGSAGENFNVVMKDDIKNTR